MPTWAIVILTLPIVFVVVVLLWFTLELIAAWRHRTDKHRL